MELYVLKLTIFYELPSDPSDIDISLTRVYCVLLFISFRLNYKFTMFCIFVLLVVNFKFI